MGSKMQRTFEAHYDALKAAWEAGKNVNKTVVLSEKVANDLFTYNAMIDEWAEGLLSLKIDPEDLSVSSINQRKKKFYWIHWKRGTKGIKHYANMMLDHLEKEQREKYQQMLEEKKEGD